ncbi:hypothetical protein DEJ48_14140 [Streptomyces venezuelae]|uniref:Uncharacterized protein n=1 Tax=Streptomyces venezuelae TaxID=54571 RepID=A0A5P2BV93_STRVZ|nr:hypothetical protein [Streptomyces venezuelae]QES34386.1 hypothetical protein DEJ48_14140 [Streptomyces venezuelae]
MTTRILPAVGDVDVARALSAVTGRLPGAGAAVSVGVFGELLDHVAGLGPVGAGGDASVPPRDRTYTLDEDK